MKTMSLYAVGQEVPLVAPQDLVPPIPRRSSLRVDTSSRRMKAMSMYLADRDAPPVPDLPSDYRRELVPAPLVVRMPSTTRAKLPTASDTSRKLKAMSMYSSPPLTVVQVKPTDEVSPTAPTLCEEQPASPQQMETKPRKLKRKSLYIFTQGQVPDLRKEIVHNPIPDFPSKPPPSTALESRPTKAGKPERVSRLRKISTFVVRFFH